MNKKISKLLLCVYFIPQAVCLADIQAVKVGSSPNNEDGDTPRDAYTKINSNFGFLETQISFGAVGFVALVTNNSPTAVIQATFDSLTSGGVVSFQPGTYAISKALTITNSIFIQGNNATLVYGAGLTNYMVDTGTNFGKKLIIYGLNFNGGIPEQYNTANYFSQSSGIAEPFYSPFWTNRTGLRVECSGGVYVECCDFYNWPGNGILAINKSGSQAYGTGKFVCTRNALFQNYVGICSPGANYEIPGYGGSDSSLWNNLMDEYADIEINQCYSNQWAIVATAGNNSVKMNDLQNNWSGIAIFSGINGQHGDYSENNLNHNHHGFYVEGGGNGGKFHENMLLACTDVIFNDVTSIDFSENKLGQTALIFTNGCTGQIKLNQFLFHAVWGVDILTNYSAAMKVSGNVSEDSTNSDGSALSALLLP